MNMLSDTIALQSRGNGTRVNYLIVICALVCLVCVSVSSGWCEAKPVVNVRSQHTAYVNQYLQMMKTEAQTGSGPTYYNTSYYLNGMISAVEATNDENELMQIIDLIDTMIGTAKDLNGDGLLEWGSDSAAVASLDPNKRPWQLYPFQVAVPIARTAAYILNNKQYKGKYGAKALQYAGFVDRNILRYWFDMKKGIYAAPAGSSRRFVASVIPWADRAEGGAGETEAWSDKASLVGGVAAALYMATKDPFHKDIAERIGRSFKKRLVAVNNGWVWDAGRPMSYWNKRYGYASDYEPAPDTSHCNREPLMMVLMYEAGLVFSRDDLLRLANTLLETIWNGSLDEPLFSNYINGSNKPYFGTKSAGGVGNIYAGWCLLGRYSPRLQNVLKATLGAVVAGKKIGQNNTPYGKVALTGHLLRNEM